VLQDHSSVVDESTLLEESVLLTDTTLLIVDDHPLFRQIAWEAFETHPSIQVVGEAADSDEALAAARRLHPQVVLMDLGLPGVDGIETTRRLRLEMPEINVVAISAWDDRASLIGALQAGARGYVTKNGDYSQLVRSVEAVGEGKGFLSPDVTVQMLQYLQGTIPYTTGFITAPEWLSDRDRAILRLIATGASNREIGNELFLSEHTVRTYLTDILARLALQNRVQLAIYAIKIGLA